jgi:hypothetical protein
MQCAFQKGLKVHGVQGTLWSSSCWLDQQYWAGRGANFTFLAGWALLAITLVGSVRALSAFKAILGSNSIATKAAMLKHARISKNRRTGLVFCTMLVWLSGTGHVPDFGQYFHLIQNKHNPMHRKTIKI